jgi:hypothetical protein
MLREKLKKKRITKEQLKERGSKLNKYINKIKC